MEGIYYQLRKIQSMWLWMNRLLSVVLCIEIELWWNNNSNNHELAGCILNSHHPFAFKSPEITTSHQYQYHSQNKTRNLILVIIIIIFSYLFFLAGSHKENTFTHRKTQKAFESQWLLCVPWKTAEMTIGFTGLVYSVLIYTRTYVQKRFWTLSSTMHTHSIDV